MCVCVGLRRRHTGYNKEEEMSALYFFRFSFVCVCVCWVFNLANGECRIQNISILINSSFTYDVSFGSGVAVHSGNALQQRRWTHHSRVYKQVSKSVIHLKSYYFGRYFLAVKCIVCIFLPLGILSIEPIKPTDVVWGLCVIVAGSQRLLSSLSNNHHGR